MNSQLEPDEADDPISIMVSVPSWHCALNDPATQIRSGAMATLDTLGFATIGAEVSFLLTGDAEMQTLNRRWRKQDKPTNVLSFPALDLAAGDKPSAEFEKEPLTLGDVVLAYETIALEAASAGISFGNHVDHLVVHGVLHLLGYDHQSEAEAALMEDLERQVLSKLGVSDPYNPASEALAVSSGVTEARL